jgi:phage gp36-like protein
MGHFLTVDDFIAQFGEAEARQIAGSGDFNSLEGSQIDHELIEAEIAFTDELIAGYVFARHAWVGGLDVADIPNLLKGLGGDIVRYRLRDKESGKGQISDTVETRYKDALKRLEAIQAGKLDVPRDRLDGADLEGMDLPEGNSDAVHISGPAPQSDAILEGY